MRFNEDVVDYFMPGPAPKRIKVDFSVDLQIGALLYIAMEENYTTIDISIMCFSLTIWINKKEQ